MSVNENLSKILDIEPIPVEEKKIAKIAILEPTPISDEVQDDYELSRKTFRSLIQKGDDALDHLIDIAKESEHPRSFEVLSGLIKTVSDTTKELMDIHKKNKDIRGPKEQPGELPGNINVEKAVFVGTPADLLRKIKANE